MIKAGLSLKREWSGFFEWLFLKDFQKKEGKNQFVSNIKKGASLDSKL